MNIRPAEEKDLSRIAEILVFAKRINFRPIFQNDAYSFGELQVLSVAREYSDQSILEKIWVYDDGIVKGLIHIDGEEIKELYVEPFFQSQGVGEFLIEFAKANFPVSYLWAIEKNIRAIRFYEAHGFFKTHEKKYEDGTTENLILLRRDRLVEEECLKHKRL